MLQNPGLLLGTSALYPHLPAPTSPAPTSLAPTPPAPTPPCTHIPYTCIQTLPPAPGQLQALIIPLQPRMDPWTFPSHTGLHLSSSQASSLEFTFSGICLCVQTGFYSLGTVPGKHLWTRGSRRGKSPEDLHGISCVRMAICVERKMGQSSFRASLILLFSFFECTVFAPTSG